MIIPYGKQDITEDDIDAVVNVLRSDFITQGPMVPRFEKAIADYCGVSHAVAVNSATSALHLACLALGLGVNDWLWTSPITFVASPNSAIYCGASVDFVDIDPATYNISIEELEAKLKIAKANGILPKVVMPVHMAGQSCDMEQIFELSKIYGFKIIEDASHAIGGRYKDHKIGSCNFSDITVFSFHPVKIITTGEGGLALTNSPEISDKISLLRSHGITRDQHQMTKAPDGPWYYQQIGLGYNYRMTDIQAALGLSQFKRVDAYISRRQEIARKYDQGFSGMPLSIPYVSPDNYSAYHLYIVRLDLGKIDKSHNEVFVEMRSQGIGVNLHYIPVHRQPYYEALGFKEGDFPAAEAYYAEAISLPMFPNLSDSEQQNVIDVLAGALA